MSLLMEADDNRYSQPLPFIPKVMGLIPFLYNTKLFYISSLKYNPTSATHNIQTQYLTQSVATRQLKHNEMD